MGEIKVRNVDRDILCKIDQMAANQNMSREGYLRKRIEEMAIHDKVRETEDKYANLVWTMADVMQGISEKLDEVNSKLEEMEKGCND